MPIPILGAIAIGVSVGAKILGSRTRKAGEKARAEALKENALVQLGNTLSGLNARQREELAAARQQKRLGRRQSAILEARAIAGGAESGTGSAEQVQDVALGESEFLSSIDQQLGQVSAELERRRRRSRVQFESAVKNADAGVSGIAQDFLDFANTAAFALNAFDAIDQPGKASKEDGDG